MQRKWKVLLLAAMALLLVSEVASASIRSRLADRRASRRGYDMEPAQQVQTQSTTQAQPASTDSAVSATPRPVRMTRRSYYAPQNMQAIIDLRVPANAEVLIDGVKTNLTGTSRQFYTADLNPEKEYTLEVKARWTENGREVTKTRQLTLSAGSQQMIDFVVLAQPGK